MNAKEIIESMGYKPNSGNYRDIPASFSYLNGSILLEIYIKIQKTISDKAALEYTKMINSLNELSLKLFLDKLYELERYYWYSNTTDESDINEVIKSFMNNLDKNKKLDDSILIKYDFFSRLSKYLEQKNNYIK